jgi:UDP-2,3-diacylglucosamine hydrolase
MNAIFFSDVHLKDADSLKTKLVLRFLQEQAAQYERIYFLGDLFDVWPGTNAYLLKRFEPVLEEFRSLVKDGHELTYVEGNHDFRLGEAFSKGLGIRVIPNEIVEDFNGKKVHMAHGDLGNPKLIGYRILRKVLRNELVQQVARVVPSQLVYGLGDYSSRMSRDYQLQKGRNEPLIRDIYRACAERLFAKGNDVVIMGHTHIPDDYRQEVDGRSCRYFNTGDWVKSFTYLVFDGNDFYTKVHPVTGN